MIDQNTHIALVHFDSVPNELLDEFCASVNSGKINFSKIPRPEPGPQMSMEWIAFPAIALFFLKPYIDGFMKEAGKEHYHVLKGALKSLWKEYFSEERKIHFAVITASGKKKLRYSMLFSIYFPDKNGHLVKLLFREDCSEEEYFTIIDSFMDLIESYSSTKTNDNQVIFENLEAKEKGVTFIEYDRKSKSFRIVNPRKDSGNI